MRRALKFLAVLVVLIVVAVGALIAFLPTEKIAQLAADKVREATGRELTLTGDLSPSFYPVLGIQTGAITLSNAEWGDAEHLVSAKGTKVGVELIPLLSGAIKVSEVRLIEPVISLEINEEGTPNWEFPAVAASSEPAAEGGGFVKELSLGEAVIEGGAVRFVDFRPGGTAIELEDIDARIALAALDQPLEVDGDAIWNGEEAKITLFLATPQAAMNGEALELKLSLASPRVEIAFDGAVTPPAGAALPAAKGSFAIAAADPTGAVAWATGVAAPAELAGLSDLDAKGAFDFGEAGASLDVTGGLTRDGRAATLALKLAGGADWMEAMAFDVDLSAKVGDAAALSYVGRAGPGTATPAELDGRFSVSAADPAGLAAWATGAAPEGLTGLSDVSLAGTIVMNADRLAADAEGGATRDGRAGTLKLKLASGGDWARTLAFDVDLAAAIGDFASLYYVGAAGPAAGAPARLDGRYKITAADPAALAAWATGSAPDALRGLSGLDFAGSIDMSDNGLAATATGAVSRDGQRANIDLKAASGADWAASRAFDLALNAGLGDLASLKFNGAAAAPANGAPRLNGRVTANIPKLRGLAAFAGAELPKGKNIFQSAAMQGAVALNGDRLELTLDSFAFDKIAGAGTATAALGGAPNVNATLSTGPLNLRPYMQGGESGPSGPGWSKERIDLSGLGALSGVFKIRASKVLLPTKLELGKSDITAALTGGKLDLNIRELGVYGGGLVGDIAVDGRNGNAIRADISANAVQLLPMLRALADMTSIEGLGRVNLKVAGAGASLHDIMNSLDGSGAVKLTDGALVGYNLAAMARNITSAFSGAGGGKQKTDFSEVSGTFKIRDGVLSNADFQFLGPLLRVVGEGTVDIGGQSMKFRLVPKAVASLTGQGGSVGDKGLAFPILISGPWSNLSFTPDLQAGIQDILKDPEGALNAVKGITDGIKDGGVEGAAGAALEALTGQGGAAGNAGTGGALDAIRKGADDPAGAALEALTGTKRVTQADINAARREFEAAKAAGDVPRRKKAWRELQRLRELRKAQKDDPVGGLIDGLLKR